MKKFVISLIFLCFVISAVMSQTPLGFKYQAVVRDSGGNPIVDKEINLQITLLQGSSKGMDVYRETHKATSNSFGLVSLNIGNGSVRDGDFEKIDWSAGRYFIKIEMDTDGGENFKQMGISELFSVPFAMYAMQAGDVKRSEPFINNKEPRKKYIDPRLGGTRSGDINSKVSASGDSWLNALVGNVGIGTSTPVSMLDVNGVISTPEGTSTNWSQAYNWGDHTQAGYLSTFDESDPLFSISIASGITKSDTVNWSQSYKWGDHAQAGYLTSFNESDPLFAAHVTSGINVTHILSWHTAFEWGNHAQAGYLTTEKDPKIGALSQDYISKWDGSTLITSSIYDDGNVGIGNDLPEEKLHVTGNVKVSGSLQLGTTFGIGIDDPCTPAEAGKIIFNGSNFCACDGTVWKRVD